MAKSVYFDRPAADQSVYCVGDQKLTAAALYLKEEGSPC